MSDELRYVRPSASMAQELADIRSREKFVLHLTGTQVEYLSDAMDALLATGKHDRTHEFDILFESIKRLEHELNPD